jgi:hypothetical protein
MNPIYIPTLYFLKSHFNIILTLMLKPPKVGSSLQAVPYIKRQRNKDNVLRILQPKSEKVKKTGENCATKSFVICTSVFTSYLRVTRSNQIEGCKIARTCHMGRKAGNAYKILVGKPEGKSSSWEIKE